MHAYAYPSRQEKVISGAFAFGMHLVFLALLVFGVTWPKRIEPQANIVDLWANLPSPAPPKVEPPRPRPELKLEVKPPEPPPVKPVAKPEVVKPDIAIKEKAEKERRALEEKQKEAKKREAEAKAAQKLQREKEAEAKAAQKLQREKEAEAQRLAREQEDAQRRIAEQQASAQARLRNEYIERIRSRIKRFVVMPPNMQGNPEAEFDVVLLPGGEVLSVKLKRASGNAAYDSAVERAIHKAAPLPLPPDPALFRDFRELNLKFRSQE
ncbi:MAG: cell envelope integrity protein TolA [Betaproteobacteria bacterium]|nr:cell envelope integrity protein TolA [Betaproteobacteria bacterium]